MLHSYVFALLSQKEGKRRLHARSGVMDYGESGRAAKEAIAAAKAVAGIRDETPGAGASAFAGTRSGLHDTLAHGWSEIRDPVTGATCYWNVETKKTVWARPTT